MLDVPLDAKDRQHREALPWNPMAWPATALETVIQLRAESNGAEQGHRGREQDARPDRTGGGRAVLSRRMCGLARLRVVGVTHVVVTVRDEGMRMRPAVPDPG